MIDPIALHLGPIEVHWYGIIIATAVLAGARLGTFVNQELYGPPTNLPWGIPIDAAHRAGTPWDVITYPVATTRFVPLFAYEAILNLIGMVLLLYVARRYARRLYDGDIALLYIVWYGWVRSALETLRVGNWYIGPLPTATWLGLAGVLVAAGVLLLRHARGWGTPGGWMHERPPLAGADGGGSPSVPPPESEPSPG